jgi:capsular polysaccharide biosynthesis protein
MTAALLERTPVRRPAAARPVSPDRTAMPHGNGRRDGGPVRTWGGYLEVARRRRTAIALGTAVGLVGALLFLGFVPPTFAATEDVLVLGPTSQLGGPALAAPVDLDTEAQLVGSETIAQAAAAHLGEDTEAVRAAVDVTVPTNTTLMRISYRAASPARARAGASAVAAAYLAHRRQEAESALAGDRRAAQKVLDQSRRELVQILRRRHSNNPSLLDAATQRLLHGQVGDAAGQLATLSATVPLGGRIVRPAVLPTAAQSPDRILVLLSGLAAGVLLGLAVAAARDRRDPVLADADDVGNRFGLPVLGTLRAGSADLRRLVNLLVTEVDGSGVRAVFVAPLAAQGAGLAAELAGALAAAGHRATLLRRGGTASEHVPATPGLTVEDTPAADLSDAVARARLRGDLVVLEGGPEDVGAAPARLVEAVLVVVQFSRTTADELDARLTQLRAGRPRLIGIVGGEAA